MIFSLAITGPTASGKTALSLSLARELGCEIISCDSMQIYRGMDVGTAKATPDERALVPHHLIDILEPGEDFSAERYRTLALAAAEDITSRGRLPMFVGGTGLYIDTVMRCGADSPESDPEYRAELMRGADTEQGRIALWERLNGVDPECAATVHYNNVKRVIRALEIFDRTGRTKSELDKESRARAGDIAVGMITIDFHDRECLYRRVDIRVDAMLREGLLEEARSLYERGLLRGTAAAAIGYKELLGYIRGEQELDAAVEELKLATRRYAKRQITWFRHETDAYRLFADDESGRLRSTEELILEATGAAKRFIQNFNAKGQNYESN